MSRKNANNDGSIRKRANGTWEGRYTDGYNDAGKQIQRSVYGKTRKEVADKIRDILVKKQSGTYIAPSQYLLSDWMIQWLQTYAKNAIKPSTYISYEGYIYNHINPDLGSYPIQQITTPMVQEFYNQKFQSGSKRGGGLSPKTLRNMHNMFHQAMEQARINGMIAVNPTDGTTLPRREQNEMRVLSLEEERRLLSVIGMHRLGMAILFDLATGLRIGELCALKWSDINFQKQTVKISRTLQRIKKSQTERDDDLSYGHCTHIMEASVKTQSGFREIPIPNNVFAKLMEYKVKIQDQEKAMCCGCYTDNGYLFASPTGGCVEPSHMRDVLNDLLQVAGIDHVNFHALRHTFATRAIERGVNVKTLSDILGHSQVQITMDLYCHTSIDHMRDVMNSMSDLF